MKHNEIFELLKEADPIQTMATGEQRLMPLREFLIVSLSRKIHEVDECSNVSKESIASKLVTEWKTEAPREWRVVRKRYHAVQKEFKRLQRRSNRKPKRTPKKKTRIVDLPAKEAKPKSSSSVRVNAVASLTKKNGLTLSRGEALDNDVGLGQTRSIRMVKGLKKRKRPKTPYANCPWCGLAVTEEEGRVHKINRIAFNRCTPKGDKG